MIGRVSTLALVAGLAMSAPAMAAPSAAKVQAAAKAVQPKVVAWRRDIHENPELGNQEVRTAALIAKELRALGIEVRENVGKTGVVGVLKGGKPGKVVALRADMDALPVEEKTGLPFASKVKATWEGRTVPVMHACGHDTHVAMLLGAATVLAGMKQDIKGTVVFLFQPAEEGPQAGEEGGAKLMIRDGALDNPKVDAVFGLHIGPGDAHELNYRPEGFYASSDRITITVKGRQTHGARPWAGVDMASVAADIIQATNQIAARQVDVGASPSVLTIATINMGFRQNIIPEDLKMEGTMRTFSKARREDLIARMQKSVAAIGDRYGAKAEVVFTQPYPVTYNDPALSKWVKATLEKASPGKVDDNAALVTGAEDFSMYAEKVPGVFIQLGGRKADVPAATAPANHSPYFDVDEAVFETGVKAEVLMALDYLDQKQK
ncbi:MULTISPECIES: M20 family metallopeptidase [unclassified Caulobacter]|jgi:amidohydrolase|uniref:M20 family metallopeptidase n=1 Tax=unclassified Caulobacter TaxID=2648921 RepID=UPI0007817E64|nr:MULTISPECIES: M20 family metallopeptidase [unclassified Caulobacter]AZS20677.1 amidohydrolase [Caulobacter sp. FWC26]